MKKSVSIILLFLGLAFCSLISMPFAATQTEIIQNPQAYPDLLEYRQIFFGNLNNQDLDWFKKCQKIIEGYKRFLQKYPQSEFVDEVKLGIAEFYELSFKKEKALPYLDDIIQNNPQADYFSIGKNSYSGEKTAAWALYYRGLWFLRPQSIDDWERILREYPESKEVIGLAKSAILKYRNSLKNKKGED